MVRTRFLLHSDRCDAALCSRLASRLSLRVFISHRASAGSRDPEEIQRNCRPGAALSQTPGPRYGVSACSVLSQPERVSACVHILTKRSAVALSSALFDLHFTSHVLSSAFDKLTGLFLREAVLIGDYTTQ